MRQHVKNYLDFFGYKAELFEHLWIPCEMCGTTAVDLHHIEGGRHKRDNSVHNIIALCRHHHNEAHSGIIAKYILKKTHNERIIGFGMENKTQ